MVPRSLLIALLLLAAPLTGCLSGDDKTDAATEEPTDTGSAGDTPPDGRGGRLIAFEETNETEDGVGGVDHHHDMWQGRDRMTLFETRQSMEPFPGDQNEAYSTFRVPMPGLVHEGTERIEFTISDPQRRACEPFFTLGGDFVCTDNTVPAELPAIPDPGATAGTPLLLRYKHASTTTWLDAGPITWNQPATIQLTNPVQTDMPHSTSSLWEFQVVSPNGYDVTLTFTAKAEIIRGNAEIPLWPGHPQFYTDEKPTREVLRTLGEFCAGASGCATTPNAEASYAERLISYGTKSIYVWLNVTSLTAPNPALAPTHLFLYHRNATGQENLTNPFETTSDVTNLHFILPVRDNDMDSPYADGSRWNFNLGGALTTPVISCYAGCAEWSATYELVVLASNKDEGENYYYHCIDDSC